MEENWAKGKLVLCWVGVNIPHHQLHSDLNHSTYTSITYPLRSEKSIYCAPVFESQMQDSRPLW